MLFRPFYGYMDDEKGISPDCGCGARAVIILRGSSDGHLMDSLCSLDPLCFLQGSGFLVSFINCPLWSSFPPSFAFLPYSSTSYHPHLSSLFLTNNVFLCRLHDSHHFPLFRLPSDRLEPKLALFIDHDCVAKVRGTHRLRGIEGAGW